MFATFVLPAPRGCNLNCPYCAVALRNEASDINLADGQYLEFLSGALSFPELKQVSIVGYEPTLDEVFDLTFFMLKMARAAGIRTSMNTNGLNLPKHIKSVAELADQVMISLDSHIPERNDKLRGKFGTFEGTVAGIRAAVTHMGPERVIVNTLLVPQHADFIDGLPEVLSGLGVTTWVISPYIEFNKGHLKPDIDFIKSVVLRLAHKAAEHGVAVKYADEFRVIGQIDGVPIYNFQRPGEPGEPVFRLSPNGSCSVGDEILTDSSVARVWDGFQDPAEFIRSL